MGDSWSNIPPDLLDLVMRRLYLSDAIRCGAVCKSWLTVQQNYKVFLLKFPWLLLGDNDCETKSRGIFSLPQQKRGHLFLPQTHGRCCSGISKGWLVTVDVKFNAHLLHPFNAQEIKLPPLPHYYRDRPDQPLVDCPPLIIHRRYIFKAALSCDPNTNPDECVVMIIYGEAFSELAFCSLRDEEWTLMPKNMHGAGWGAILDVTFYQGRFYVVTAGGRELICTIDSPNLKFDPVLTLRFPPSRATAHYLVEFMGDLLHVVRYLELCKWIWYHGFDNSNMFERRDLYGKDRPKYYDQEWETEHNEDLCSFTYSFKVFKVDRTTNERKEVASIGDHALFVGRNESVFVVASNFPGCRPNCIYFCDDWSTVSEDDGCQDMGVYMLDSKKIESICPLDVFDIYLPPPVWLIAPQLQSHNNC